MTLNPKYPLYTITFLFDKFYPGIICLLSSLWSTIFLWGVISLGVYTPTFFLILLTFDFYLWVFPRVPLVHGLEDYYVIYVHFDGTLSNTLFVLSHENSFGFNRCRRYYIRGSPLLPETKQTIEKRSQTCYGLCTVQGT